MFIAVNNTNAPIGEGVGVTPVEGSCIGLIESFGFLILPAPDINPIPDITVCGGQVVGVTFSGTNATSFTWTNSNPAIGLAASGTGNLNFTTTQVASPQNATITVTPHGVNGCAGTPTTFNLLVNPAPAVADPPDVSACAGEAVAINFSAPGTAPAFNWTNSNPAIGLPASGMGNIAFTAPTVAAPQTGTITVHATDNGCTGPPQMFSIQIKPLPSMQPPVHVKTCAGQAVAVAFSGTAGATFSWTNSNPAIGLPASGTGNLSFAAAPVAAQEVATVTVTPLLNGCAGPSQTFTITVNPLPTVLPQSDQTACPNEFIAVDFESSSPTAAFQWTNSNFNIGLGASGTGDLAFTAADVATTQVGVISVRAVENGCTGPPELFSITVRPLPEVTATSTKAGCDSMPAQLKAVSMTSPAQYLWAGPGGFTSMLQNPKTFKPGTYTVTLTDPASGCTATATTVVELCCITKAGTMDTALVTICGEKSFAVPHAGDQKLEPNDRLRFVLFSNPKKLWDSVIARSDTAFFPFLPGVIQFDSIYYVVAIAGDSLGKADSINVADPCYSVSKRSAVRWVQKPTIQQLPGLGEVCRNGCVDVVFGLSGEPPFRFVVKIVQGGQVLYTKSEIAPGLQHTVIICPKDFSPPGMGGMPMDVQVSELEDGRCGCGG